MPNWWCGPRINVPKWARAKEARSSIRRRIGSLNQRDGTLRRRMQTFSELNYGSRLRDSLRRSRRAMSMRNFSRNTSNVPLRRTASLRESLSMRRGNGTSLRRPDGTLRRRRSAADIRVIRRPHGSLLEANSCSSNCSNGEGSDVTEQREMTKQADNLWREYKLIQFQEKLRDDMLLKLHQANFKLSPLEIELAAKSRSFAVVKRRADSLLDQMRVLVRKFLVFAQGDPGIVEACFEIVEEEDKRDAEAAKRLQDCGFETPERPRAWKDKVLVELRKVPLLRVENTPRQEREVDRNWLAKHMEIMSQKLKEDLNIVKGLYDVRPAFDVNIARFFVDAYYECLAQHIQDIVSTGLRHNEIIQLLSWLTEHKIEMQRLNPTFIPGVCLAKAASDLLPEHTMKELEQNYLKKVKDNVEQWAHGALTKEQEDWNSEEPPKENKDGFLYTEFPVHLFDLIRQNLVVAKEISIGTHNALLAFSLKAIQNIVQQYADALKLFIPTRSISISPPLSPQPPTKSKQQVILKALRKTVEPHLTPLSAEERRAQANKPKFYVQYSVAALNNFETLIDHSQVFQRERLEGDQRDPRQVEEEEDESAHALGQMRVLERECLDKFMSDLCAEITPFLRQVGTKHWFTQNSTSCIGDVCDTITAYTLHLRRALVEDWRDKLEQLLFTEYLKGFVRKRDTIRRSYMKCSSSKERGDVAEQMSWESDQMENTVLSVFRSGEARVSPFNILRQLTELLQLTDKSTIVLEITSMSHKHPELTRRHIKGILKLRGDLKKSKIKKILMSSMAQDDTDSIGSGSGESIMSSVSSLSSISRC